MKSLEQWGLCEIFHAMACSLPPEPIIKIFIAIYSSAKFEFHDQIMKIFL
jgi:hypothetical protein